MSKLPTVPVPAWLWGSLLDFLDSVATHALHSIVTDSKGTLCHSDCPACRAYNLAKAMRDEFPPPRQTPQSAPNGPRKPLDVRTLARLYPNPVQSILDPETPTQSPSGKQAQPPT